MVKLVMTYIAILVGLFVAQYLLGHFAITGILTYLEAGLIMLAAIFILRGFRL